MSDSTQPDAALAAINARIGELNLEIEQHQRLAETARVVRDELSDIVATISRKPRIRKPRAVTEAPDVQKVELLGHTLSVLGTLNVDNPHDPKNRTVFATPCLGDVPQEAA